MNKYLLFGLVGLAFVVIVGFAFGKDDNEIIKNALKKEAPILLDVRSQGEWDVGHIENSIHIPLDVISINFDKLDTAKTIVVYCQSGARSERARFQLKRNGFKKVINGGGWKNVQQLLNELEK